MSWIGEQLDDGGWVNLVAPGMGRGGLGLGAPQPELPQINPDDSAGQQAKWNRTNQANPFGTTTWSGMGPGATQTTRLAPGAQNAFDRLGKLPGVQGVPGMSTGYIPTAPGAMARTQLPAIPRTAPSALPTASYVQPGQLPSVPGRTNLNVQRPQMQARTPMNVGRPQVPGQQRLPQLPNAPQFNAQIPGQAQVPGGNYEGSVGAVRDSVFQQAMNQMRPEFDMARRRTTQDMANMGIPMGAELSNETYNRMDKAQNDAMLAAALASVQAGGAEQNRLAGLDFARFDRGEDAARARFGMGVDAFGANLAGADFNRTGQLASYDRGEDASRARFGMGMDLSNLDLSQYDRLEAAGQNRFNQGMNLANLDLSQYDRQEDAARSRFGMGMDAANTGYAQRMGSNNAYFNQQAQNAGMGFDQRIASDTSNYDRGLRSAMLESEESRMAQRQPFEDQMRLSDLDFNRRMAANQMNLTNQVTTQNANLDLIGRQMGQAPAMQNVPIDTMTGYQMQQNQALLAQQLAQQRNSQMWGGISQLGSAAIMGGM